ncbi:hypothetical protein LINGRAHAP2_LOCUS6117 [Linum grandiflorum]
MISKVLIWLFWGKRYDDLVNMNSLVSRIYKAKYLPTTELLTANLGHRPSCIWRSLCEARTIVQFGYRLIIGNGQQINVWSEA